MFTVSSCKLIKKTRDESLQIYNSCFKEIKRNKMPRKSHKNSFKFANFPNHFIQRLKSTCRIETSSLLRHFNENLETFERKVLQLNKLESFLLKLVIPFIRIAHCPQSSYLKVKGDLILISADISHSLEKNSTP